MLDFTQPDSVLNWRNLDDRVMGGVSRSRLRFDPQGHAVFEGEVSLVHNGGFASVRSVAQDWGQPGARACWLELRASACGPAAATTACDKTYTLSLFTDDRTDSLGYQARFRAPGGLDWQRVTLPLADFRPRFRGQEVPGAPALDPACVRQLGLLVGQRQAGPFALALRRIAWV